MHDEKFAILTIYFKELRKYSKKGTFNTIPIMCISRITYMSALSTCTVLI